MADKKSKVAIERSFFELAYFCVLFDHKVDSPDKTPSPTCQTRYIYLIWRPSHRALTRGVSFRIHIRSHTHEKGPFFTNFFLAIFGSFSAIELLYWTRLRAPHIKHDLSNLVEDPYIVFWREDSRFGLIFSLTLTKKGHFSLPILWLFFAHFGNKTALPDQTLRFTCQTTCL